MSKNILKENMVTDKTESVGEGRLSAFPQKEKIGLFKRKKISFIIIFILMVAILILSSYRLYQTSRHAFQKPINEVVETENSERLKIPDSDLDPEARKNIF